jgi:EAL domain-containing protein (putative c-di-GMP-specific phosphodiesterase class I)
MDVAAWQTRDLYVPRVAINLSPRQLVHGFEIELEEVLRKYNVAPNLLELEITENVLLEKRSLTLGTLEKVRNLGISLALDDFGTGYSSLSHLREYPIQRLKIDRLFVREIARQEADVALASAIISLAKAMAIQVIAEGIEAYEQLNLLRELGCHEGQGFLLGRPCPADRVSDLLESSSKRALRAEVN